MGEQELSRGKRIIRLKVGCCRSRDVLIGFAYIVKVRSRSVCCLLNNVEFTSDEELDKVGGCLKARRGEAGNISLKASSLSSTGCNCLMLLLIGSKVRWEMISRSLW